MRALQSISFMIILLAGLAWAFGKWILNGIAAVLALVHLQSESAAELLDQLLRSQDVMERWISVHPNLGWTLIVFAGSFLLVTHAWPAIVRRWKVPALEIAYDNSDPRFVRRKIDVGPTGIDGGEYHAVAIRNNSSDRTLHDVFVREENSFGRRSGHRTSAKMQLCCRRPISSQARRNGWNCSALATRSARSTVGRLLGEERRDFAFERAPGTQRSRLPSSSTIREWCR